MVAGLAQARGRHFLHNKADSSRDPPPPYSTVAQPWTWIQHHVKKGTHFWILLIQVNVSKRSYAMSNDILLGDLVKFDIIPHEHSHIISVTTRSTYEHIPRMLIDQSAAERLPADIPRT